MTKSYEKQLNIEYNEGKNLQDKINSTTSDINLSQDTLIALEELGSVLLSIHKRMVSKGFEISEGCIRRISE